LPQLVPLLQTLPDPSTAALVGACPRCRVHASRPSASGQPMTMQPNDASNAILDPAALEAIRELDAGNAAGLFGQVVAIYLEASPALVRQIEMGLSAGDASGVQFAAHTLKSSSANLGARRLAQLCAALEQAARGGALPDGTGRAAEIQREFEAVRRALEQETGKPAA
jgi:HPt (histidine-containing phosphotransfer) domain-containing protein